MTCTDPHTVTLAKTESERSPSIGHRFSTTVVILALVSSACGAEDTRAVVASDDQAEAARASLADASPIRIEMTVVAESLGDAPVSEQIWERSIKDRSERYQWDFRGLVEPWLRSQELADDVENLVYVITDPEPSDAGIHLAVPALRFVEWSYESECRTRGEDQVRSTLDDTAMERLGRTIDQMPQSAEWRSEVFGNELPPSSEIFGSIADPSRPWTRSIGWGLVECAPTDDAVQLVDEVLSDSDDSGTTIELGPAGNVVRVVWLSDSYRYVPDEYGPVQIEVLVSYEVEPDSLSFPDEADIHREP